MDYVVAMRLDSTWDSLATTKFATSFPGSLILPHIAPLIVRTIELLSVLKFY